MTTLLKPGFTPSINQNLFPPPIWREIEAVKQALTQLEEGWPSEAGLDLKADPSIYDCYPYLFLPAFPSLLPAQVRPLSQAGRLFASSFFLGDQIMDRISTPQRATKNLTRLMAMQAEGYLLLNQVYPPHSLLWTHFREYFSHYVRACNLEQDFATGQLPWQNYTKQTAFDIATGKAGLARTVVAGLAELAEDKSSLGPLAQSINHYNFAFQMLDDLGDWKDDLLHQTPSLLLCQLLGERPAQPPATPHLEELARCLYYEGQARYIIEQALEALNQAFWLIWDLPTLPWKGILSGLRRCCQDLLDDVVRITRANLVRLQHQPPFTLELPSPRSQCQQLAFKGLDYLVHQWQLGFGEARHMMIFSHDQGFSAQRESQYGDVFQRALLADVVWEAAQSFGLDLKPVLDYELNYLLSRQLPDGIGGWSYFPDLPELPPDADDLAQILQLLVHVKGIESGEAARYCEKPLATLLTDNIHLDGSFETWIIPNNNRTTKQERHSLFVQTAWGSGPDNDVIANLLYALALYDPTRYAKVIERGTSYLESRQQADGCWLSTWYHGPYYGTYACLRLLALVRPHSPTLEKVLSFLVAWQNPDGGWGLLEGRSDALSTALALLSWGVLANLGKTPGPGGNEEVRQALRYLERCSQTAVAWEECEFIRMELGRASGQGQQVLSYGSKSVTTAFVLKAALAWEWILGQDNSLKAETKRK